MGSSVIADNAVLTGTCLSPTQSSPREAASAHTWPPQDPCLEDVGKKLPAPAKTKQRSFWWRCLCCKHRGEKQFNNISPCKEDVKGRLPVPSETKRRPSLWRCLCCKRRGDKQIDNATNHLSDLELEAGKMEDVNKEDVNEKWQCGSTETGKMKRREDTIVVDNGCW